MPWLTRGEKVPSDNLFFVHVPRCGGTSLTQHFNVPRKCRNGRSLWGKFGMLYFFYRYKLLETANFPVKTWEALIALIQLMLSIAFFIVGSIPTITPERGIPIMAYTFLATSLCMFTCSTFLFTAPFIGRVTWIRRPYLVLVHHILFRFMESIEWCTGTNIKGYMMHLTAQKIIQYEYVSAEEFDAVCSLAIVRNPYSRMVSVYNYNRFGPAESFPGFMKRWYKMMHHYRENGEMEEYYTPCHCIPQFEYTHFAGKQLVQSVVKQEELKYLKTTDEAQKAIAKDSTVGDLPDTVRNALLGMPHTNRRDSGKKWFEYFDQETLDMTYEMYKQDFTVFGYSPKLSQRPDLDPPKGSAPAADEEADEEGLVAPKPDAPKEVDGLERMQRNSLNRLPSLTTTFSARSCSIRKDRASFSGAATGDVISPSYGVGRLPNASRDRPFFLPTVVQEDSGQGSEASQPTANSLDTELVSQGNDNHV